MADSLKTYFVRVPAFITVTVQANSEEEAEDLGEARACNLVNELESRTSGDIEFKIDDKWEPSAWEKQ